MRTQHGELACPDGGAGQGPAISQVHTGPPTPTAAHLPTDVTGIWMPRWITSQFVMQLHGKGEALVAASAVEPCGTAPGWAAPRLGPERDWLLQTNGLARLWLQCRHPQAMAMCAAPLGQWHFFHSRSPSADGPIPACLPFRASVGMGGAQVISRPWDPLQDTGFHRQRPFHNRQEPAQSRHHYPGCTRDITAPGLIAATRCMPGQGHGGAAASERCRLLVAPGRSNCSSWPGVAPGDARGPSVERSPCKFRLQRRDPQLLRQLRPARCPAGRKLGRLSGPARPVWQARRPGRAGDQQPRGLDRRAGAGQDLQGRPGIHPRGAEVRDRPVHQPTQQPVHRDQHRFALRQRPAAGRPRDASSAPARPGSSRFPGASARHSISSPTPEDPCRRGPAFPRAHVGRAGVGQPGLAGFLGLLQQLASRYQLALRHCSPGASVGMSGPRRRANPPQRSPRAPARLRLDRCTQPRRRVAPPPVLCRGAHTSSRHR